MKSLRGSLLLLLTAVIWGMAFVAQSAAADSIGSFTFNTVRSLIAALFLALLLLGRSLWNKTPGGHAAAARTEEEKKARLRRTILGGVLCGAALCIAVNLQQAGIAAYPQGVAASGRSGFLTAMYVVFVALCSPLVGKKLHPIVLLSALGFLLEKPKVARHIFSSRNHDVMLQYMMRVTELLLERHIALDGLSCGPEDQELILSVCAHALYGMLEQWLTQRREARLEADLLRITQLFESVIHNALLASKKPPRPARSQEKTV